MNNVALAATVFLVSSALYAFIGLSLRKKTFTNKADSNASHAFHVWWFGMAINNLINAISLLTFAGGITAAPVYVLFSATSTLAASAALWGLMSYLLYVFTGGNRPARWVAGFYAAFALFLFYSLYSFQPIGVALGDWQVAIQYANTPTGLAGIIYVIAFLLLIALPPVLASIGMFTLYFRVKERSSKYRALLVPLGIFGLFGLSYLLPLALFPFGVRTGDLAWWPLTIRIIGLVSLLVIYWAYFPPSFIQKNLKVSPVTS